MVIRVQNATKIYTMGSERIHALDNVSFSIQKGELVAIIGPSGSGKTTLMHMIGGLDSLDKGTIEVDSKRLERLQDKEYSQYRNKFIGFVFQNFYLQPNRTALENVELPLVFAGISPKERKSRAQKALEKVELLDRMDHKPTELSGGQRQRVSIARAIVNEPQVLLADEPTGNLDSKAGEQIINVLRDLNKEVEVTVIVVTHDDRIAKKAHRILRIEDGRIVDDVRNGKSLVEKYTD